MDRDLNAERPCCKTLGDWIDISGNGAYIVRDDESTVRVIMPNGGYVVLVSVAPIEAFCVPE